MAQIVVEVAKVDALRPHSNADRLEIAVIKGWQVVVAKGSWKVGDKNVYFPPESVLPEEAAKELGVDKYLSKGRVRQVRLRREASFGLVVPPANPDWEVGRNVADHYGVTKFIPPYLSSAEDIEPEHPAFIRYPEPENLRNFPAAFNEGEEVIATEKIHGTHCRIGMIEGEWVAGSKTRQRKRPADGKDESSWYWFPQTIPGLRSMIEKLAEDGRNVIVFGEVFGRVQNLKYGLENSLAFRTFDIAVDGRFMGYDEFEATCQRFGVEVVPVVARFKYSLEETRRLSEGPTLVSKKARHIREGNDC